MDLVLRDAVKLASASCSMPGCLLPSAACLPPLSTLPAHDPPPPHPPARLCSAKKALEEELHGRERVLEGLGRDLSRGLNSVKRLTQELQLEGQVGGPPPPRRQRTARRVRQAGGLRWAGCVRYHWCERRMIGEEGHA